ncbi:MAG: hypothetical protein ABIS26_02250 [Candidatus Paceibacterota bacterium]
MTFFNLVAYFRIYALANLIQGGVVPNQKTLEVIRRGADLVFLGMIALYVLVTFVAMFVTKDWRFGLLSTVFAIVAKPVVERTLTEL